MSLIDKGMADGVDHRRRAADRAGLAAALDAQRIVGAGRALDGLHREVREVVGARHRVVHVAAGQQLAAVGVVDAVLAQRLAQALRQAAVDLAFDDHRVDDVAEVVAGGEAVDAHDAGGGVDLDLADVAAGRVGEVARIVEGVLVEARLELVVREVVRHVGGERDARERHALVGARHLEDAVLEHHVGVGRLHQVGGDLLALGDDLVQRLDDRGAAHGEAATAVGAHAEQHLAGVAMLDRDVLERDAQLVGHDLRERGLVALAMAVAAGEDGDLAGGMHAHLAGLEQAGARAQGAGDARWRDAAGLDVGRVAEAALQALGRAGRLARFEAGDVGELDRARHRRLVVAGVVGQADRRRVGEGLDEVAPAQLGRVDAQLARRGLDDALDRVGGLGSAGAAVGIDRARCW